MKAIKATILLATTALVLPCTAAFAQQAAADTAREEQEEIVITGSRLISNGNDLPTPVTVIPTEQLQNTTPSNIADGLNKLPQFVGSRSQGTRSNPSAASSGNFLNLRNFGIIRTLILLDGRRAPPTNADQTVDVNLLPQLLVNRVDVVTGGVSAVYGSDAVSGVVNFVLDKKFDGLKAVGNVGISDRGDSFNWRTGIAGGTSFGGGRGHVIASYEHYKSDGLPQESRFFTRTAIVGTGSGTAANPFRTTVDARIANSSLAGLITTGALAGRQIVDGALAPYNRGTVTGSSNAGIFQGGEGLAIAGIGLRADLKTDLAFARVDYDITPDINVNLQGSYSVTNTFNDWVDVGIAHTLSSTNAFLPVAIQNQLLAAGETRFGFGRGLRGYPRPGVGAKNKGFNVTAGIDGSLGKFDWQAYYTHSKTDQTVTGYGNVNRERMYASLDAVRAPNGQIVCNVTLTHPGLYPGCVPFNPLGSPAENMAAFNYRASDTSYFQTFKMDNVGASITGSPFETWAGPVRIALSGEYRKLSIDVVSESRADQFVNCTGLRFGENSAGAAACSPLQLVWNFQATNNLEASYDVIEGAAEIDVPLLRDFAVAKLFSVNAAARYTHYSTSGTVWTWKLGLNWQVTDDLRFRGTRSRDIRAPTLLELFRAPSTTGSIINDQLHTGLSRFGNTTTVGNPDLKPEVANTVTLGAVYSPRWLPGMSMAVDYYKIKIRNGISSLSGGNAIVRLLCEQSGGTSPYCDLIIRPLPFSDRTEANFPTLLLNRGINVAQQMISGIDTEVNYTFEPWAGGRINLRALVAYQPKNTSRTFETEPVINSAGAVAGGSKWRVNLFAGYVGEFFELNTQWRWRSGLKRTGDDRIIWAEGRLPSAAVGDVNLTFKPTEKMRVLFTVENLLDKAPTISAIGGDFPGNGVPVVLGDDIIGRRYTAGVRFDL